MKFYRIPSELFQCEIVFTDKIYTRTAYLNESDSQCIHYLQVNGTDFPPPSIDSVFVKLYNLKETFDKPLMRLALL